MSFSIRLMAEPVRTLAFGSIGAAYMGIGTVIDNKSRIVFISNLTDANLMFSFDGVNDHFPMPVYGFIQLTVCQNKTESDFFSLSVGDRIYVKEITVPSQGSVNVTVFHGKDE